MIKLLQVLCDNFYVATFFMIKISCLRGKNNNRKTLVKQVTWQNHSVIAKFRILKGFKKIEKKKLPPFGKFVTEKLIFRSSRSQLVFFHSLFLIKSEAFFYRAPTVAASEFSTCSIKKGLLEILQISQENTCVKVYFC